MEENLKKLLSQAALSQGDITPDTTFDELGIDSLELFELIVEIEVLYEIELPDNEILTLEKVSDLINLIEKCS